jgi:hypothetical protein
MAIPPKMIWLSIGKTSPLIGWLQGIAIKTLPQRVLMSQMSRSEQGERARLCAFQLMPDKYTKAGDSSLPKQAILVSVITL